MTDLLDTAELGIKLTCSLSLVQKLCAEEAWLWGGLPIPDPHARPRRWSVDRVDEWLRRNEERHAV